MSQEDKFRDTMRLNSSLVRKCEQKRRFLENSFLTVSRIDTTNLKKSQSSKFELRHKSCMPQNVYGKSKSNLKQVKITNILFEKAKSVQKSRKAKLYKLAVLSQLVHTSKDGRENVKHRPQYPLNDIEIKGENCYLPKTTLHNKNSSILESS